MHTLSIDINPINPCEYLAGLGMLEVLNALDPNAQSVWTAKGLEINTTVDEPTLVKTITGVLTNQKAWKPVQPSGFAWPLYIQLAVPGTDRELTLDWWLGKQTETGQDYITWKMFAGNRDITQAHQTLISAVAESGFAPISLRDFITAQQPATSRFGFDPAASSDPKNRGWSPDGCGMPVPTPCAGELLCSIAVGAWFPGRINHSRRRDHTSGWYMHNRKPHFHYALWHQPLPIELARYHARQNRGSVFRAPLGARDKTKNLLPARQLTTTQQH